MEVRVYDHLFSAERPMEVPALKPDGSPGSFLDNLNPHSLELISGAFGEPCLAAAATGDRFQFERLGYFVRDPDNAGGTGPDGKAEPDGGTKPDDKAGLKPVFNKTVGLRDTWAKVRGKVF
jgi:glutaminyl-tRNA synthetase